MDQFDRIFQLHRLLASRRATGLSFDDLLETLRQHDHKQTASTLKRTLRYMRERLQAPLIHDRERGGYRYDGEAAYELPGLWFTSQELAALLILEEVLERHPLGLLSEALTPFRAKLERLLERSDTGLPGWRSRLRLLRMAARPVGSQFTVVASALARRQRLRIDYHARSDDRMAPRIVSPQRLTLYRDNWYLDAWCHTREDLRIFALDRIIAAEAVDQPAQDIPDLQLDQSLATSYGIFSGEPTALAVLRFSARAARWIAAETWHPQQQDTPHEDGSLTRRLPYHRSEELIMDLLRHGADVEILEPPALRQTVIARLRAALGVYRSDADASEQPGTEHQAARFRSAI